LNIFLFLLDLLLLKNIAGLNSSIELILFGPTALSSRKFKAGPKAFANFSVERGFQTSGGREREEEVI